MRHAAHLQVPWDQLTLVLLEPIITVLLNSLFFFFKCLSSFMYFERERESMSRGGAARERIPSRLHAVSAEPKKGPELRNREIMT